MKHTVKNNCDLYLIENEEELGRLFQAVKNSNSTKGVDTETSGLDYNKCSVSGYCISLGYKKGFYLPVRHKVGKNLPLEKVLEIVQYIMDHQVSMFFNRNFDLNMSEKDGLIIPYNAKMHDVQVMCWEATNEPFPAMKAYTKKYLKWDVTDFGEAAGTDEDGNANHDSSLIDPEQFYVYAAMDPCMTVALGKYMWNNFPYIRRIYPLDNLVTESVRLMGKERVFIDYKKVYELAAESDRELRDLRNQIIQFVGYEFKLNSNKEKGEALSRFVTLTVKTKGGQFSVKDEVLSEIDHPLAQMLLKYSKSFKFKSSFINPLLKMEGTPLFFNFKTVDVPTGRMACGSVKGNSFFAPLNIQALPKKKIHRFIHEGGDLGYYLDDNPENSLGEQECKAGFRDCFTIPDDEWCFVSADYCGEEVMLASVLSGETTWSDAINRGEDVHMATSKKVFGIADKEKRNIVKTCTFLINYGGSHFTLAKRLKISIEEAKEAFERFHTSMAKMTRWIKYMHEQARRKGMVFTYYGRPRLLYMYYQTSNPKDWAFGDRSACNSAIQGCIPICNYIETKGKAIKASSHFGGKFEFYDGREGILTGRGIGVGYLILTKSGDFSYVDENHAFIYNNEKHPKYRRVNEGLNVKILASKLQRKLAPATKFIVNLFTKSGRGRSKSVLYSLVNKEEVKVDRKIATHFFVTWLTRGRLRFSDFKQAVAFRSIASVFGYNLIMDPYKTDIQKLSEAVYRLKWSRKKKYTVVGVRKIESEQICSVTMTSGYQMYPTCGFLNKNTGADIMRILLCKFFQEQSDNPEFKENCKLPWHVHDEINVYVKKSYLFTFFYKLRDLMWVRNDNWAAPLKSDIGVGTTWGNGLNVIGVTPENKLIVEGLNDDAETMERTRLAVKAAGLKWDDDLGLERYKPSN